MYTFNQQAKEKTHPTVGTVSATTLLGCLVDLDVLDDQIAGIQTLGVCVGFGVLEETEEELGRLDGPAGTSDTELFAYYDGIVSLLYYPTPMRSNSSSLSLPPSEAVSSSTTQAFDHSPCAARPVPPAYLLIGTASLCPITFSRYCVARPSFQPLIACAVSRVFLNDTRR